MSIGYSAARYAAVEVDEVQIVARRSAARRDVSASASKRVVDGTLLSSSLSLTLASPFSLSLVGKRARNSWGMVGWNLSPVFDRAMPRATRALILVGSLLRLLSVRGIPVLFL